MRSVLPRSAAYKIFWLGRYLERMENIARFMDSRFHAMLDGVQDADLEKKRWASFLSALGLLENFYRRFPEITSRNVTQYVLFDTSNPSSLLNAITLAREDGNGTLPNAIYIELHKLYLQLKDTDSEKVLKETGLHEFLTEIIHSIMLVSAMVDKHWVY